MKFTNHNSNCFKPTTHNIGQSLVNDVWTIANKVDLALCRWQDAADNGYGFLPWWGEATDLALEGFDWFCSNVLRNLVAIAVYTVLLIIELGQHAYSSYVVTGKAQAHTEAIVEWARAVAAPKIAQAVDGVCRFLLCYQEPETQSAVVPALDLSEGDELITWSRSRPMSSC